MVRPEGDDHSPVNVEGMQYYPIKSWEVAEWHDLPDGQGDPTAVIMILHLDEPTPLIARLKSRAAADELIVALMTHSKAVWPDDPVTCEGFDPDAICKCGRRLEDHTKGSPT